MATMLGCNHSTDKICRGASRLVEYSAVRMDAPRGPAHRLQPDPNASWHGLMAWRPVVVPPLPMHLLANKRDRFYAMVARHQRM
jgi:hypothetical protein